MRSLTDRLEDAARLADAMLATEHARLLREAKRALIDADRENNRLLDRLFDAAQPPAAEDRRAA